MDISTYCPLQNSKNMINFATAMTFWPLQFTILLKETKLLKCYMEFSKLSFTFAVLYNTKFYLLSDAELNALAEWIELNLRRLESKN